MPPLNILCSLKDGFRGNMSCELQLLGFIRDLTNNMQSGKRMDVLVSVRLLIKLVTRGYSKSLIIME